jgi:hypothetical protein
MLIIIYDKGNVRKDLVLAGQTGNSAYYCDFYGEYVKLCEDFATNFGDKTRCCVATMHRFSPGNFLPKTV